ncbi:transcriptional regulator [marine gamma proteobacterium HTCC2207]|jgi:MarR family transcriptional regulator for hemolysin|uniref:Transcriptional regulator n=1 Tax=gamma proteobacterium HTCC2207 TaxID=314287 RepID=Q1YU94_9GAMM|nr:transcriptional regulator [marine gamma proteobacterium HTCC2207] [gamma proteobacterium HTCC2207]MBT6115613.1 MarR family transcriptional regulator [Porticoccaceae bacterium]
MSNTDIANNDTLGFIIHDVARMMRWNFERRAHEYNLTRSQWSVLVLLSWENGAQQKRLADIIGVTAITMTGLVDRLERNDWVERRQDPQDRRAKRVFLTDKVEPLIEKIKLVGIEVRESALKGISASERQQLTDLLSRMRANLCAQDADTK